MLARRMLSLGDTGYNEDRNIEKRDQNGDFKIHWHDKGFWGKE